MALNSSRHSVSESSQNSTDKSNGLIHLNEKPVGEAGAINGSLNTVVFAQWRDHIRKLLSLGEHSSHFG